MKEFLKNLIDKGGNILINIERSNVTIGNSNTSDFKQLEYPQNQKIAKEKKQVANEPDCRTEISGFFGLK